MRRYTTAKGFVAAGQTIVSTNLRNHVWLRMAAHLRRSIRLYVNGNRFSPSFSPLSGARPFMGARSFSSSSMPSSPNQAPKRVIAPTLAVGVIYSCFEWMDCFEWRSSYDSYLAELARIRQVRSQAEIVKLQREIAALKATFENTRLAKESNTTQAA